MRVKRVKSVKRVKREHFGRLVHYWPPALLFPSNFVRSRFLSHGAMSIRHGMLAPTVPVQAQVGAAQPDGLQSWRLLEEQEEEELHERIVEQNVDVPVPQITVPFQEEIVKMIKPFPAERVAERTIGQIVDCVSTSDLGRGRRGGEGWFRSASCTSGPNFREDL